MNEDMSHWSMQCETVFTKYTQAQPHMSDYVHVHGDMEMKTPNSAWHSLGQERSVGGRQRAGSV